MGSIYDEVAKYREDITKYILDEFGSYNIYFGELDLEGGSVDPEFDNDGTFLNFEVNKIMHLYKPSDTIEQSDGHILVNFINDCISQFTKDNPAPDELEVYFDEKDTIVSIFTSIQRISIWWTIELMPAEK